MKGIPDCELCSKSDWTFKKRLQDLFFSMISFKGFVLGISTWLFYIDKLSMEYWTLIATSIAGLRQIGKYIYQKNQKEVSQT